MVDEIAINLDKVEVRFILKDVQDKSIKGDILEKANRFGTIQNGVIPK